MRLFLKKYLTPRREEIALDTVLNTRSHLQRYLAASDAAPQITVEFRNITAKVPASIKNKEMKTILNNVSGIIKPGEFVALMGPSGAGKSSLLNILGSRFDAENGECSGEIHINGQPKSKKFKKHIGYVLQKDFILPNLTVRETLEITAKLRLPSMLNMVEKMQRVEDIVQVMGLQSCANTIVQKVSGGESKRLSIANELLINPSVLFSFYPGLQYCIV